MSRVAARTVRFLRLFYRPFTNRQASCNDRMVKRTGTVHGPDATGDVISSVELSVMSQTRQSF